MGTEKIVPIVPTVPNPGKWGSWWVRSPPTTNLLKVQGSGRWGRSGRSFSPHILVAVGDAAPRGA